MLGIIRVLTHPDQHFIEEHGRLIFQEYGINSISRAIPEQHTGIFDDVSEALAVPKIVALGQQLGNVALDAVSAAGLFIIQLVPHSGR
jgi:hypothetical protein